MNAHDRFERQLREAVAATATKRRMRPDGRSVLVAVTVAVTLAVVVIAFAAVHSGSSPPPRTERSTAGETTTGFVTTTTPSQTITISGAAEPTVDQSAITAALNTAYAKDPACQTASVPVSRSPVLTGGPPPASLLSAIPALAPPAPSGAVLPAALSQLTDLIQGAIDVRYVTKARVVDGTSYWLVPVQGAGHAALSAAAAKRCDRVEISALISELAEVPVAQRSATRLHGEAEFVEGASQLQTSTLHDGLDLFTTRGTVAGSSFGGGLGPAQLETSGLLDYSGSDRGGVNRIDGVVPAGVAQVTLQFASTDVRANLNVRVVNDVFVLTLPTGARHQRLISMLWLNASGMVIKSINERSSGA
jgi:hypothetical protein